MAQDFRLLNLTLMLQRILCLRGATERVLIDPEMLATDATEMQRFNHAQALLYEVLDGFASRKPEVHHKAELLLEQVIGMLWAWGVFTENKLEDMREHPDPEQVLPNASPSRTAAR